jgi:hypothetical protein
LYRLTFLVSFILYIPKDEASQARGKMYFAPCYAEFPIFDF